MAALLASAGLAISVTASLSPAEQSRPRSILDDPLVVAQARQSVDALNEREAARNTPSARTARSQSRLRYRGASDGEAFKIARDRFPALLGKPAFLPFRPDAGQRVEHYLNDDQGALITTGEGARALVESTLPLRGTTATGETAPVDLDLVENGGRFAPTASPVRAELPKDLADGFALPYDGGTLIVHAEATSGSHAPRAAGDKLFYANAARDTDLVAAALPTGTELSDVLRSVASPETLEFGFDSLPPGAELRLSSDKRAAEIIAGDKRLAVIPPPTASDADGEPVPVALAVSGTTLELGVAHRDRDVAYPLVVDPVIETFTWGGATTNNDFNGWTYTFVPGAGSPSHASGFATTHWGIAQWGLYTYTNGLNLYHLDDGVDRFRAPGDAYVYRADFNGLGNVNRAGAPYIECLNAGIYNVAGSAADSTFYVNCNSFAGFNWGACVSGAYPNCNAASGSAGNAAQLDYWAYLTGVRANGDGIKNLGGAVVYLNDRVNPTIQWSGDPPSQSWSDYSGPFAVLAQDSGLGVKSVSVSSPTAPGWAGATLNTGCNGTRADRAANRCTNPQTLSFSLAALPEGVQTVHASTNDAVSNPGSFDYTAEIDHTAPDVQSSGSLKAAAYDNVFSEASLHVEATDGANDGNPTNARSGVASVEIQVDGQRKAYFTNPSPCDNCSLVRDWSYRASDYSLGKHTITVIATDQVGHVTPAKANSFDVTNVPPPVNPPTASSYACSVTSLDVLDSDLSPMSSGDAFATGEGACKTDVSPTAPVRVALQIEGQYQTRTCLDPNYLTITGNLTGTPLDGSPEFSTAVTVQIATPAGPGAAFLGTITLGSGQTGAVTASFLDSAGGNQSACSADASTTMNATGGFSPASPGGPQVPNLATTPPSVGQAPALTVTGPLKGLANKYVSGDLNLYAEADVGPRVNTGAGNMTVSIQVDGLTKASSQRACTTVDCTVGVPLTFHPTDYSRGTHTVGVVAVDGTGSTTSTWSVTVDASVPTQLGCTAPGQPVNFTVYSVGASFADYSRTALDRVCPPAVEPDEAADGLRRPNLVSVMYGTCSVAADEDACQPPLEIQTWPACERNRSSYYIDPDGDALPRQDVTIRGVPAAWFDDGSRLEIYTGASTVVIFGINPFQMQQAALAIVPTAANPFVNPDAQTHLPDPSATLPPPASGALSGTLPCA